MLYSGELPIDIIRDGDDTRYVITATDVFAATGVGIVGVRRFTYSGATPEELWNTFTDSDPDMELPRWPIVPVRTHV